MYVRVGGYAGCVGGGGMRGRRRMNNKPVNTNRVIRSCAWYLVRMASKIKTSAQDNMVV